MCPLRPTFALTAILVAFLGTGSVQAQNVSMSILKIDDVDPVAAGTNLVYTISVSNEGPDAASNATLDDPLPAGTTFASLSAPAGWVCTTPGVGATGTVNCVLTSMPVGTEGFTLTVNVDSTLPAGSILTNVATISSDSTELQPGDETATELTTIGQAVGALSVAVTDAPDPVAVGSPVTYAIAVTNSLTDGENPVLTVPIPLGSTFSAHSADPDWTCSVPAVGGTGAMTCTLVSLQFVPVGTETFSLTVIPNASLAAGSTIECTASLVLDTSGRSVVASDTEPTGILSPASVSAIKQVSGSFVAGGSIVYTIVLANAGPGLQSDNAGDEFTDVLPAQLALTSATASSGLAAANTGTNTVTWNGSIPALGSVTITIFATTNAAPGTPVSNQAQVSYDANGDGTNEATAPSDDPAVAGTANPTVFQAQSVVEIPTLSEWGLLGLAGLLGIAGARQARRRR